MEITNSQDAVSKDKSILESDETCACGEKESADVNQQDGLLVQDENKQDCVSEVDAEANCKDVTGKTVNMESCSDNEAQSIGNADNIKEVNVLKEQMESNGYQQVNPTGNPMEQQSNMDKQVNGQVPYQAGSASQQLGYVDPAAYAAWQQAVWIQQQQAAAQRAAQAASLMGQRMFQGMQYQGVAAPQHPIAMPQAHTGFASQPASHDHHVKHDEHKYGQLLQVAQKFATGTLEPQDVATGLSIIQDAGDQFWRGLLVGGVAALILGSESVRTGLFSMFSKDDKNN